MTSAEPSKSSRSPYLWAHLTWMVLLAAGAMSFAYIPGFIGWCGYARTGCDSAAQMHSGIVQAFKAMGVVGLLVSVVYLVLPWARWRTRVLVAVGFFLLVLLGTGFLLVL